MHKCKCDVNEYFEWKFEYIEYKFEYIDGSLNILNGSLNILNIKFEYIEYKFLILNMCNSEWLLTIQGDLHRLHNTKHFSMCEYWI